MKQVKKGYVIQQVKDKDYLQEHDDSEFGPLTSAHIFKLKREAQANIEDANAGEGKETVLKAQITAELL